MENLELKAAVVGAKIKIKSNSNKYGEIEETLKKSKGNFQTVHKPNAKSFGKRSSGSDDILVGGGVSYIEDGDDGSQLRKNNVARDVSLRRERTR